MLARGGLAETGRQGTGTLGHVIIRLPSLLAPADVQSVLDKLSGAVWQDGKQSAQGKARDAKTNLVVPAEDAASSAAGLFLLERLSRHERFRSLTLPRTVLPFTFCRYDPGMAYGTHLDLPMMGRGPGAIRTDISMTLFLGSPDEYDGGTLVFDSESGEQRIRGELGEAVLYPASALHRVETVLRGSRIVAITWIQSLVRDANRRRIVSDLSELAGRLDAHPDQHEQALIARKTQYELLRMWAD